MTRRWHLAVLIAILLLAGGLRLAGLGHRGLSIDEGFSIALASLDPGRIVAGTAADQHPPLYYLLLHSWIDLVGHSLPATRALSALLGWLTVPLVYLVGRRQAPAVGLLAAGLLAVSPAHIWYSQDTRMYALLVFLGTLSTWLAWRWWTDGRFRSWGGSLLYVIVTLAVLYTHSFGLFLVAAQNISGLALEWRRRAQSEGRRQQIGGWLLMQLALALGFLPWLPVMIDQMLHHRLDWIGPLSWSQLRHTWLYLLYGRDWQASLPDYLAAILGLALLLLALVPPLFAGLRPRRSLKSGTEDLAWIGIWFGAPFAMIVLAALWAPIFQDKQLLIVLPPLIVLIAVGLSQLQLAARSWTLPAGALVLALALTAGPLVRHYAQPQPSCWSELAASVNTGSRPGDLLYLNAAAGALALDYYLQVDLSHAGYPPDYALLTGGWAGQVAAAEAVDGQLGALARQHSRVWLVEFSPGFWDPGGLIRAWLERHGRAVETTECGGLALTLFAEVGP